MEADRPRAELPPNSFISVTLLKLKGPEKTAEFMRGVQKASAQVAQAPGLLRQSLYQLSPLMFLTRTAWENEPSMRAFRDSGDHAEVMRNVRTVASLTAAVHWTGDRLPTWPEAQAKLAAELRKRISKQPTQS